MATPEEIKALASQDGGGKVLYDQYREGKVSLSDIDTAMGTPGVAQNWIDTYVNNDPVSGIKSPTGAITDPNLLRSQVAGGLVTVPGAGMTAQTTSFQGTLTDQADIQQLTDPTNVSFKPTANAPLVPTTQAATSTGAAATPVVTSQASTTEAAAMQPTGGVTGTVSQGATAESTFTPTGTGQAVAETVQIEPGSTMEAALGTMSPEALAEAAKVAGLETSRIEKAKTQMRTAGLSDAQIAAFSNDPNAMELELTNFSEQQRGVIAGMPVEALVSTQMEQLLAGIDSGEMPNWSKPAIAAVEAMLARRGLTSSTVGRDALVNAIIQAALPIAQGNAETIKQSAMQQTEIVANARLAEAQFKQQAVLQNAQNVFNLNVRNLDAQQQANLANSQFMQSVSLTNANNRQQTTMQNAVAMANLDVALLDTNTRLAVENAKAFLTMDMANMSNEQQALMIDTQYEQQRMLSNAAAQNAAAQFNSQSVNQTNQFMAGLKANMDQFNAQQINAINTFNATEANRTAATNAGNQIAVEQFNTQLMTQVEQFNAQQDAAVQQWNAANAQAVEQSNVAWRRQANTADTAAQNAINQQNVQNAFNLTAQAQASMWQEMRDTATFSFQETQNAEDRRTQLYAVAIGNKGTTADTSYDPTQVMGLVDAFFGNS